jgi:hypothetical protein
LREKPGKTPFSGPEIRRKIAQELMLFKYLPANYRFAGTGNSCTAKPGTKSPNREITGI